MLQQMKAVSQRVLTGSVLEPHPKYRTAIGVLGVVLPPALVLWAMDQGVQSSISAYYYTTGRDWFVGTLWVIGVFLIFYQYHRGTRSWRSHAALSSNRAGPTLISGNAPA